jgi:hypothetical protein
MLFAWRFGGETAPEALEPRLRCLKNMEMNRRSE